MCASKSSRPVLVILIHPNADNAGKNVLLSENNTKNFIDIRRINTPNDLIGGVSKWVWIGLCGAALLILLVVVAYLMLRVKHSTYEPVGLNKYGH